MKPYKIIMIIFLFVSLRISAEDIHFPPELLWWINEVKKANRNIEINSFVYARSKIEGFVSPTYLDKPLIYPVFMRWNYYGHYVAYFDYGGAELKRQRSGRYTVQNLNVDSHLFIANRNREIFFVNSFGIREGLNAIHWLTDTILIGIGLSVKEEFIDLFIQYYIINNNTVEIKTYEYINAFRNSDRNILRLNWYEQRPDYFESAR
jgi:hypothetical protein